MERAIVHMDLDTFFVMMLMFPNLFPYSKISLISVNIKLQ
ncbi:hypothetical protein J2772_003055 [Chryseobacterium jejuense]|nr:hypothetical protein [Chryseobacterium jejuense]